jgi:phosphoglycerate dehydrogenase-like enzyme
VTRKRSAVFFPRAHHVEPRAESVGTDDLRTTKPTALPVDTSRASRIAPGAPEAALDAGRPGMAAVDVFDVEPLRDRDHPLLGRGNEVCTPHVGCVTRDENDVQFADVLDQILACDRGVPIHVVNPAELSNAETVKRPHAGESTVQAGARIFRVPPCPCR